VPCGKVKRMISKMGNLALHSTPMSIQDFFEDNESGLGKSLASSLIIFVFYREYDYKCKHSKDKFKGIFENGVGN